MAVTAAQIDAVCEANLGGPFGLVNANLGNSLPFGRQTADRLAQGIEIKGDPVFRIKSEKSPRKRTNFAFFTDNSHGR